MPDTITPQKINDILIQNWPTARCFCKEVGPKQAIATLTVNNSDLRPGGFVSGPTQFATADAALWFLCFGAIGRIEPLAMTSDLNIRFLNPARGKTVFARAELHKIGKRSMVGSVTLWTDDPEKPCAIGQGTYILP